MKHYKIHGLGLATLLWCKGGLNHKNI